MSKDYVVAKYIRLSSEDTDNSENDKKESDSVTNQRDLLNGYIKSNPCFDGCTVLEFCDDGRTGTNFDRPGVHALLDRAQKGTVQCIIVKDLSRFARNYLEAGNFLEQLFPLWGVRFISVNDMYDSDQYIGSTGGINIAFRNLIHDIYSHDLSEKVRSARMALGKRGACISPFAFYGYVKSKADKHKLVMDEEAAEVVRQIFDMAESGSSSAEIAKHLNENGVPTPQMRQKQHGNKRKWHMNDVSNFWDGKRVANILRDERYTGKMISCKTKRLEVGKVKTKPLPKEEWIVVPGAFLPIISEEQFQKVQDAHRSPQASMKKTLGDGLLFYRKIKCGICRRAMPRSENKRIGNYYTCESSKNIVGLGCTREQMPESVIAETVLLSIRQMARFADKAKTMLENETKLAQNETVSGEAQIKEIQVAIEKMRLEKLTVYDKYRDGFITIESFIKINEQFSEKISEHTNRIAALNDKIGKVEKENRNEVQLIENIINVKGIHKLTRPLVDSLIKAVYICDSEHIEIIWNFQDEYAGLMKRMKK